MSSRILSSVVGLYLSRFVFSYGQFYVTFFKLHFRKGFKLENNESMFKNCTINVVYWKVSRIYLNRMFIQEKYS